MSLNYNELRVIEKFLKRILEFEKNGI